MRALPCGAAAVANAILAFVERGDRILMTNTAYEQRGFLRQVLGKLGMTTKLVRPIGA